MPEEKKGPPTKQFPSGNSLFAIIERGPAALRTLRAAAGHPDVVSTRQEEDISPAEIAAARADALKRAKAADPTAGIPTEPVIKRGSIVRHIPTGKKVTVLAVSASAADVVSHSGKKWQAKLSELK